MRKLVYGALALGAALILSVANPSADGSSVKAVETTTGAVTAEFKSAVSVVGMSGDNLIIDAGDAKEVLVGTAKVAKAKGVSTLKVSAWDTYEVGTDGEVTVDLSKISTTKESYIRIKADAEADSDAITIKLPAVSSKLKATYNKATEAIDITDSKQPLTKETTFYWRTVNGETNTITTTDKGVIDDTTGFPLETYRMSGGVIYLSSQETGEADWSAGSKTEIVEADGKTAVYAVTAPVRRSKELKVTIAKRANAPKLSVNYVKGTITIPAKAEYRVLADTVATQTEEDGETGETGDASKLPGFTVTAEKKELILGTDIDASKPFAIDVRTAKDASKKKPASKIGHTTFKAQEPTTYSVEFTNFKSIKNKPDLVNIEIKNTSETEIYTFFVGDDAKGTTIKAGKTGTLKNVAIAATTTISVQRVGDKKTETWAGPKTAAVSLETFTGKTLNEIKAAIGAVESPTGSVTVAPEPTAEPTEFKLTVNNTTGKESSEFSYKVTDANGNEIENLNAIEKGTDVYININKSSNVVTYGIEGLPEGVTAQRVSKGGAIELDSDGEVTGTWKSAFCFTMPECDVSVNLTFTPAS